MNLLKKLIFLFLFIPLCSFSQPKPNVLFITVDDLTVTGSEKHPHVKTPSINKLKTKGIWFTHAYCQSPICIPSRTSLLSGLRPQTTRVYRHEERNSIADVRALFDEGCFVTLPEHFKKNGYFTARVGKIYHAGVPKDIGSDGDDDPFSWTEKYNPIGKDKTENWCSNMIKVNGGGCGGGSLDYYITPDEDSLHLTDAKVATQVIRLLKENKDKNFFIGAGFYLPHPPFIAPQKYFDMYPVQSLKLYGGKNYDVEEDRKDIPYPALVVDPPYFGISKQKQKEALQAYYASVSFVDAQVGRVLKALMEMGLEENTFVILLGDHGWMLGEHGLYRKHTPFEEVAKAPLIISGPGISGDSSNKNLVEFVNLFPTLTELCHLPEPPQKMEGYSMVPLLKNQIKKWDKPAYTLVKQQVINGDGSSYKCFGYSVRTERYRYTEWTMEENGQEHELGQELYDHIRDPLEKTNLAFGEKNMGLQQITDELHSLLWNEN